MKGNYTFLKYHYLFISFCFTSRISIFNTNTEYSYWIISVRIYNFKIKRFKKFDIKR